MRRPSILLAFLIALASMATLLSPTARAATTAPAPQSSIATPFVDQSFILTGNIGTKVVRPIQLQRYLGSWKVDATAKTAADGSYSFTTDTGASLRRFRVVAPKTSTLAEVTSAEIAIRTQKDTVGLVLTRNRSTGFAIGTAAVPAAGRLWALQVSSGSKWIQVGAKVAETANGAINATFPLGSHSYRLVGDPVTGSKGATSSTKSISAGPTSLGTHLLFANTDSGTLPSKKGVDYPGSAMIDDGAPIRLETFAVRGNSSVKYDKKSFKVKFVDSQSVLGLPKGKTFALLPNYQDHSLVRTAVGVGAVAGNLDGMGWQPHRAFTELFVNGQYRGSYEMIETIKIQNESKKNAARVAVNNETGMIVEINPSDRTNVPGIFKGAHKMYFGLKDPDETEQLADGTLDPEGVTPAKAAGMKTKVNALESAIYGKNYKDPVNGWTKYLDMNSAVDFYLEKEFIKDWDGDFQASTYFYTNDYSDPNAKFLMGPIWDVDRSAGSKTSGPTSVQSPKGWWMNGDPGPQESRTVHTSHWFVQIAKDPAFQKALKVRWAEKRSVFKGAGDTAVDAAVAELTKTAAANDRAMWQKSQPSGRYKPRASSYDGEIAFVKKWYKDRYSWMNGELD